MANFSVDLGRPSEAGATPVAPVNPVDYGSGIAKIGNIFGELLGGIGKAQAQEKHDSTIDSFTKELTNIQESGLDPAQTMTRSRAVYSKYIAQFPSLGEDFKKQWNNLKEGTNLGQAASAEQKQQEILFSLDREMTSAGWGYVNSLPDEASKNAVRDAYSQQLRASKDMENQWKANAEARAQSAERRAQSVEERNMQDFTDKQRASSSLVSFVDGNFKGYQLFIESEMARAQKDPSYWQTAQMNIQTRMAGIEQFTGTLAGKNPEFISASIAGFKRLTDLSIAQLDPKTKSEGFQNVWNAALAQQKLAMFAKDQNAMSVIATSSVFGNNGAALAPYVSQFAGNVLKNFLDPNGRPVDAIPSGASGHSAADTEGYYRMWNLSINNLKSNDPKIDKEKTQKEATAMTNNILKSLPAYGDYVKSPVELRQFTDMITSPNFAIAMKNGLVSQELSDKASEVWRFKYQQPVVDLVKNTLSKPFIQDVSNGKKEIPMSQLVDVVWNGNTVQFSMKKNSPYLNQMEKEVVRSQALEMNNASKAVNELVVAGAHLAGTTDYKSYWEANKHKILPNYFPNPSKLKPGDIVDGKKYVGGNAYDASNWETVDAP